MDSVSAKLTTFFPGGPPTELTIQTLSLISVIFILAVVLRQGDFISGIFFPVHGAVHLRKMVSLYILLHAISLSISFVLNHESDILSSRLKSSALDVCTKPGPYKIKFIILIFLLTSISLSDISAEGLWTKNVFLVLCGRVVVLAGLIFTYQNLHHLTFSYYYNPNSDEISLVQSKLDMQTVYFEVPYAKIFYSTSYFVTMHSIFQGSLPTTSFMITWVYFILAFDLGSTLTPNPIAGAPVLAICGRDCLLKRTLAEKVVALGISFLIYLGYDVICGHIVFKPRRSRIVTLFRSKLGRWFQKWKHAID